MTQPAKVQEPSMEEILASIRRIIADDEAKPAPPEAKGPADVVKSAPSTPSRFDAPRAEAAKTEQPNAEAPKPQPAAAKPSAAKPSVASPAVRLAQPPVAPANSQDDIDAMLAGLDEATSQTEIRSPQPDGEVFELTDDMALPDPPPNSPRKIEPQDDLEFSESATVGARPLSLEFQAAGSSSGPLSEMLSRSTASAVESAFNSLAHTVLSNNARTLEDLVKDMLRPMLKNWLDDNLPGLVERIVKAEIERVSRGR